jgi:hypothetical protein
MADFCNDSVLQEKINDCKNSCEEVCALKLSDATQKEIDQKCNEYFKKQEETKDYVKDHHCTLYDLLTVFDWN